MAELSPELRSMLEQFNVTKNPSIRPAYGKTIPMPRKEFPDYVFREYPKMLHEEFSKEYLEHWRQRNSYVDDRTGKMCYNGAHPKVGSNQPLRADEQDVELGYAKSVGDPVIVRDPNEEREVLERRGAVAKVAKVAPADVDYAELDKEMNRLRAENARLKEAAPADEGKPQKRKYTKRKPSETVSVKELPTD